MIEDKEYIIKSLAEAIRQYAHSIAGLMCPPECVHFGPRDPVPPPQEDPDTTLPPPYDFPCIGCKIGDGTVYPQDCFDAEALDLARWLVAQGWVKNETAPALHTTSWKAL